MILTRSWRAFLVVSAISSMSTTSCSSCDPEQSADHVAQLTSAEGEVRRDARGAPERWEAASQGDRFWTGDGLRTGAAGAARVKLAAGGGLRLGPRSFIRFLTKAPESPRVGLRIEMGEAQVRGGDAGIDLEMGPSKLRLDDESELTVNVGSGGVARFEVKAGRARFVSGEGESRTFEPGREQVMDLETGRLADRETSGNGGPPDGDGGPPDGDGGHPDADGPPLQDGGVASAVPSLSLTAGSSVVVHDPRPPTSIRLNFGERCSSAGVLELNRPSEGGGPEVIPGRDHVVVRLATGSFDYALRCSEGDVDDVEGDAVASGRIRVLHDSGTAAFGVPGFNRISADGRSYTIVYQSASPSVMITWPSAPESGSYQLHVRSSNGQTATRSAPQPRTTLRAGLLREGSYTFFYTAAGGRRSPVSRLTIRSESTEAVASIITPRNGEVSPGARARVSGRAREGSTVRVGGAALPFESPTRFEGEVTAPSDHDALAVCIAHPQGGAHCFLRYLATSAQ